MVAAKEYSQRIGRLTPLADVLACIDRVVCPVAPCRIAAAAAIGCTVAADLTVARPHPAAFIALRDGWAVRSEDTLDAGGYAPAVLPQPPHAVESGDAMPDGTDAVADRDAVRPGAAGWEALAAVTPGEGVTPAGTDAEPAGPVMRAGQRLRRTDLAVLQALGLASLDVRQPQVHVAAARADARLDPVVAWLGDVAGRDGAAVSVGIATDAEAALAARDTDLIVVVGGTGTGARDRSVATLALAGRVEVHGIALAPGETAAFGRCGGTPVLLVPGRFDAALAVWLTLGRHIVARLGGRGTVAEAVSGTLARKVTSGLGLAELVLLRRDGDTLVPLAGGYLPLAALAQSDGYLLVPPDSEGYPAGARIDMRLLP